MSKIEWCDETINPIVGCSKISAACDNCYALNMANRLQEMNVRGYTDVVRKNSDNKLEWTGYLNFIESELQKPSKWKKPKRIFVGSMTDLFHENSDFTWINKIINMIKENPHHTFMFLTKRPGRMYRYFGEHIENQNIKNLWIGVTVENQREAELRIPILLHTPGDNIRFVSVEPMLERINFASIVKLEFYDLNALTGKMIDLDPVFADCYNENNKTNKLDWVICGGETGNGARPMHPDWVNALFEQCKNHNTPFFFKSWGEWTYANSNGEQKSIKVGKRVAGGLLNGEKYNEFPRKGLL
jgi:protein gp37